MEQRTSSFSIISLHAGTLLAVFLLAGIAAVFITDDVIRDDALREARDKSRMLLDHNLAIHAYLNKDLKPAVFRLSTDSRGKEYFDPTWMSSTFAVRGINRYSVTVQEEQYYYKECAINARSPENEADSYERAFIDDLNRDPELVERSGERVIDGKPYFVVMRRGETMETPCLMCHSAAKRAPADLVAIYGPFRSFNRRVGEVVSAISVRIPLEAAYRNVRHATMITSSVLVVLLLSVFLVQYWISKRLIFAPLHRLQEKAAEISTDEQRLGEQLPPAVGRELQEVTRAFNRMSETLHRDRENLEDTVAYRTQELQLALDNVRTLSGMIPICASCKKVRDDAGYWKQVEEYIKQHSEAEFTHSICPDCIARLYPQLGPVPPEEKA